MNTFKKWIFLFILLLFFTSCSQKSSIEWIPFIWAGDTISGKYIEKAYLYIPVKIDGLPHNFTMQFDLGTYGTQFYGNALRPYLEEYPTLANKLGAAQGVENILFKDINLQMGAVNLEGIDVWYRDNFGESIPRDSVHSITPKHIGTIAPDIFSDRILIIDYKSSQFAISDSLPTEYKELPTVLFEMEEGIIKLPFHINGKEYKVMFDTGASPFQLATSKERALEISNSIAVDSLSGPLWWGKEISFYGLEVNKPVVFGGQVLQNGIVYYDKEGFWDKEVYKPLDVWGLTGNAYFFDNIVIIDYQNKTFRIK